MIKKYVEVLAKFDTEGKIIPFMIKLDDEKYEIDKVRDIRPAKHLLKAAERGLDIPAQ